MWNKRKCAKWTDTTLVHKQEYQTIKVKHNSREKEIQTQDDTKTCYQRGNRRTRQKTS